MSLFAIAASKCRGSMLQDFVRGEQNRAEDPAVTCQFHHEDLNSLMENEQLCDEFLR